jgi:predicted dehydrogenase
MMLHHFAPKGSSMTQPSERPSRAAIVGTGGRATMYTRALGQRAGTTVAALCDPNPVRRGVHSRLLTSEFDQPAPSEWQPEEFEKMLASEHIDTVVVTTVDQYHDEYIVKALDAGCWTITEKPMTTDPVKCRRILEAAERTTGRLSVTFNYRFNSAFATVHRLLRKGTIGSITSVHFEWVLDVRHGADYFRRWHREKRNSGGLMVHKASHHFDLVNWWLDSAPRTVFGAGQLSFYGSESGKRNGLARDYVRAHGAPAAAGDPFALDMASDDTLRALYLDAEGEDGYIRDQNVFGDGVTIEDDMAVLATFTSGASMSYHLTAYSPWEGCRVMFNGSTGRLELDMEESVWLSPPTPQQEGYGLHGAKAATHAGEPRIQVRPLWKEPYDVPVEYTHGGHGGADERLLQALFNPEQAPAEDLAKLATARDGAYALLVGAAANTSFGSGQAVTIADLVDVESYRNIG